MNALYILSENSVGALVDRVASAKTNEKNSHTVPKDCIKGDRFLYFDQESLAFVACGEITSDATQYSKDSPRIYVSALKFYSFFDIDNGIPLKQVLELHSAWVSEFPKWKWIQLAPQGRRPGYVSNTKVPDAISEKLWEFVLDAAFGKSVWRSWPQARESDDRLEDDVQHFYNDVLVSLQDSPSSRQARLATAPKIPDRITTTSTSFRRNPDVVAEVLLRANGTCERCLQPAPFLRASDGTPYLEVHHSVMLAFGGEDTVANAIALCPNCHRAAHYA